MPPVKQLILIVFLVTILPAIAAIGYVYSLSPAERWLFMLKPDAQRYAEALLSGDTATQGRYRDEFKEYGAVPNPKTGTVLFTARDSNEKFTLIYAPNENSAWLAYEQTGAKRIQEKWYVLMQ